MSPTTNNRRQRRTRTSLIRHEPYHKQPEAKTNPNIINKTRALPQTTGGKDEPNIINKTRALPQTTGGKDEPEHH